MNPHERALHLMVEAEQLGMDGPNEDMIARAIHDGICDAINNITAYGEMTGNEKNINALIAALGKPAEDAARDLDHYGKHHRRWYAAVKKARKFLGIDL